MSIDLGVPLNDFVEGIITSYQKGFEDAIECLKGAQITIDYEKMKKSIIDEMQKRGKVKTEW